MEPAHGPGKIHRPIDSASNSARPQGYLPRLASGFYRGLSSVHWTLTIENRATGWLTESFHHRWQLSLLHACARYSLLCPAYVLMPDHMHLIWLGCRADSDQRSATEFFRKHLRPALLPAQWQKQPYDHVLDPEERTHEAFVWIANYVLENPVRAQLVARYPDYPYVGSCVPGYPDLDIRAPDYWERFWRVHNYLLALQTTRWRSRPRDTEHQHPPTGSP